MVSGRSCKDSNLDRPGRHPDGSGRRQAGVRTASGRLLVRPPSIDKRSDVHVNTSDVMLVLIQNWSKNQLVGLITDYRTSCRWKFITIKCTLYKNLMLRIPSEAVGVRRRQSKGLQYTDWSTVRVDCWARLDRVKLAVCRLTVGRSWCSSLFTADDKVYTSHDCHHTYLDNRLWLWTVIAAVRPIV